VTPDELKRSKAKARGKYLDLKNLKNCCSEIFHQKHSVNISVVAGVRHKLTTPRAAERWVGTTRRHSDEHARAKYRQVHREKRGDRAANISATHPVKKKKKDDTLRQACLFRRTVIDVITTQKTRSNLGWACVSEEGCGRDMLVADLHHM
jgi:hypothetical protein